MTVGNSSCVQIFVGLIFVGMLVHENQSTTKIPASMVILGLPQKHNRHPVEYIMHQLHILGTTQTFALMKAQLWSTNNGNGKASWILAWVRNTGKV